MIVDLSTGRTFMVVFPYAVRKMLDLGMVNEFKTKIEMARCWTCSRGPSGVQGRLRLPYWSEKLVKENVVSELKSNRAQGRVGPGDPRGGSLPSGIPPESTTPT